MALIVGDLVERDEVEDENDTSLTRPIGIEIVSIAGSKFVYIASQTEGLSVFELIPNGDLEFVQAIEDSTSLLLGGASSLVSGIQDGNHFLYVNGTNEDGITVFEIGGDGSLTWVENVADDASLSLDYNVGKPLFIEMDAANQFVVQTGRNDDGLSVFRVETDGTLTNTANVSGNSVALLDGAWALASAKFFDGFEYIFVSGNNDDSINVYELDNQGNLIFLSSIVDTADTEIEQVHSMITVSIGDKTFLIAAGFFSDQISVFEVNAQGTLSHLFRTDSSILNGVNSLSVVEVEGETFIASASNLSSSISIYHMSADGSLELATSEANLLTVSDAQFAQSGSDTFLLASVLVEDRVVSYEFGADDNLNGTNDDDVIFGFQGNDSIDGDDGNDRIDGGTGNDIIEAGDGDDTIIDGQIPADLLDAFRNSPVGVPFSPDSLADGIDDIRGEEGDDLFILAFLNGDNYDGGEDNDTLDFSGSVQSFNGANAIDFSAPGQIFVAHASTFAGFENAIGNYQDNEFIGSAGANVFMGNDGDDVLDGRDGADTLIGGTGNDDYFVDNADDAITELPNEGYDEVYTDLSFYMLGDNLERLNFIDDGNHTGQGNALDNRFAGRAGNDTFILDAGGADIFSGGQGQDTFDARLGSLGLELDLQSGTHGGDAAGDLFASIEVFWGSNIANDSMQTGAARAKFYGFGGDDTLTGGDSVDYLDGGKGDDVLSGMGARDGLRGFTGDDILSGGAGRDYFQYVFAEFDHDTITDYQDGLDYLRVFSAVADSVSDFTITNNGTSSVLLTLNDGTGNNSITLQSDNGAAINVDSGDFVFY
ncbi:hypothetical protein ACFQ14_03885 [Pseudahrensia aquimaris]|uniref:Uncharacterized protein n=1 Tax=Pseudahrensia aquimaris TaxID=744461 RepID=A0ABW3FAR6_9HYPH